MGGQIRCRWLLDSKRGQHLLFTLLAPDIQPFRLAQSPELPPEQSQRVRTRVPTPAFPMRAPVQQEAPDIGK